MDLKHRMILNYSIGLLLTLALCTATYQEDTFCQDKGEGSLNADPDSCYSYIYCIGGYAYRQTCQAGLVFDAAKGWCDFGVCGESELSNTYEGFNEQIDSYEEESYHEKNEIKISTAPVYNNYVEENVYVAPTEHTYYETTEYVQPTQYVAPSKESNTNADDYCKFRSDGTHPDPHDCHNYIYCVSGVPYKQNCPGALIYNHQIAGCDFGSCNRDHESNNYVEPSAGYVDPSAGYVEHNVGYVEQSAGYVESTNNYVAPEQSYVGPTRDESPQPTGDMKSDIEEMMPTAISKAMSALMTKMGNEMQMAHTMGSSSRPFKKVQRFLAAKPIVKKLSQCGYVLCNATSTLMSHFNMDKDTAKRLFRDIASPLPASTYILKPNDEFPEPDPNSCPWPKYNCGGGHEKYRSYTGACNNLYWPLQGRSLTPLKRSLAPDYADGIDTLRQAKGGGDLPSARKVSHTIHEDRDIKNEINTVMVMQWGQFLDHDMSHTAIAKISKDGTAEDTMDIECGHNGCDTSISECKPIWIGQDDPDYKEKQCLEFVRSQETPNLKCTIGPREQINQITSYIDGSNVYGSTKKEADDLRDHSKHGVLKVTTHPTHRTLKPLLPQSNHEKECANIRSDQSCFGAGDARVNEQSALTSMHTIWHRQHNDIAEQLYQLNPYWDSDKVYEEARKIVGAMLQHITYNEFLPMVLGEQTMRSLGIELLKSGYNTGYDSTVDASISNAFATAAFRFGHSMIFPTLKRGAYGDVALSALFFRPQEIYNVTDTGGIDSHLSGLCEQKMMHADRFLTKQITKHLFAEKPNGIGTDLSSLNIQRGREHGIPGYNAWRQECRLPYAYSFDQLADTIPDAAVRAKFASVYKHPNDIDLFPGGMAEKLVKGGLVGHTFACIIGRQFNELRKGDRFWYENSGSQGFSLDQLTAIRKVKLSSVICSQGDDMGDIQPHVMQLPFREAYPRNDYSQTTQYDYNEFQRLWNSDYNKRQSCSSLPKLDLSAWKGY